MGDPPRPPGHQGIELDVFGRHVLVTETDDGWSVFYLGADGKRRPAPEIVVPADIAASGLVRYMDDPGHEWATERYPTVRRLR